MGNSDGGFAAWCGGWNDRAMGDAVTEAKFTKGPWVAFEQEARSSCWSIEGQDIVADLWRLGEGDHARYPHEEERAEANAHLIAAAPDMYEALEDAAMEIKLLARGTTDSYDAIMALLAKARGEQ